MYKPGFTPPIVLEFEGDEEMIKKMTDAWEENKLKKVEYGKSFWENDEEYNHHYGPNTDILRQEAEKILTDHGFKFSPDEHFTQFHHVKVYRHSDYICPYDWHIDDDNLMEGPVVTVMFFVEKDPLLSGGNLFWNPNGKEEDPGKRLINVKTGTVIIMPGDTAHVPEVVSHNQHRFIGKRPPQERKLIEFQFPDLRRRIVQDEGLDDN